MMSEKSHNLGMTKDTKSSFKNFLIFWNHRLNSIPSFAIGCLVLLYFLLQFTPGDLHNISVRKLISYSKNISLKGDPILIPFGSNPPENGLKVLDPGVAPVAGTIIIYPSANSTKKPHCAIATTLNGKSWIRDSGNNKTSFMELPQGGLFLKHDSPMLRVIIPTQIAKTFLQVKEARNTLERLFSSEVNDIVSSVTLTIRESPNKSLMYLLEGKNVQVLDRNTVTCVHGNNCFKYDYNISNWVSISSSSNESEPKPTELTGNLRF